MNELPGLKEIQSDILSASIEFVSKEAQIQLQTLSEFPDVEKIRRTEMIWSKIIHTGDCFQASNDISDRDPSIHRMTANLVAILHDCARFEQNALFGDYSDIRTGYDHAHHGAIKIWNAGLDFRSNETDPYAIVDAVYWHSIKTYKGKNTAALLIRDIDKLALLRRYDDQIKGMYTNGNIVKAPPTPEALKFIEKGELIPNEIVTTTGNAIMRMCAWQYDINFQATRDIIEQENLIHRIIKYGVNTNWGKKTV